MCWFARHGISIGHKDTDNLLRNNRVTGNGADGVLFRNESEPMAAHRNTLEGNVIENNGGKGEVAAVRVQGQTRGLVFRNNTMRDTRAGADRRQTTGVRVEKDAGEVTLDGNTIDGNTAVKDERAAASAKQ